MVKYQVQITNRPMFRKKYRLKRTVSNSGKYCVALNTQLMTEDAVRSCGGKLANQQLLFVFVVE